VNIDREGVWKILIEEEDEEGLCKNGPKGAHRGRKEQGRF
jgi:hypothetical protein